MFYIIDIIALFQALPASLHFQISGTAIATAVSQMHLGFGLAVFRLFTFIFGNVLGVFTDKCGRKPWLFIALLCYVPIYACLVFLWLGKKDFTQQVPLAFQNMTNGVTSMTVPCSGTPGYNFTRIAPWAKMAECVYQPNVAWYYVVYIILGIFTPYQPHAVGYVSDISSREDLPANQSWLGAFGFYLGLLTGFILALAVFVVAGGLSDSRVKDGFDNAPFTGRFIPVSFILSIVVICVGLVIVSRMDESIPKATQEKNKKQSKWTDFIPCFGCVSHGLKNRYFMAVQSYFFFMSFGAGANEAIALTLFQRWYLLKFGQGGILSMFLVYAILSYVLNFVGAAFTTSFYLRKVGFKNAFHIIFIGGIPTVLTMVFYLGTPNPSLAGLIPILVVCVISTGPVQPFIATLFMGQSLTDDDKGFYSGMFRSTQALGKAFGSLIVAGLIAPGWITDWKASMAPGGAEHTGYWIIPFVGYLLPLIFSYACFLLGESCCLESDRRGWEKKSHNLENSDLYINCCTRGGLVIYQQGYEEKKMAKIEEKRRSSMSGLNVEMTATKA